MTCHIHRTSAHELCACDISWKPAPEIAEKLDYELLFEQAEELGNPLAAPLAAVLRALRHVTKQRDDARLEARGERALRVQALHETARLTAQNDAARRTIAALRAQVRA